MGDMTSGGAPRVKNIVAYLQGLAGTVLDGKVQTNLRRSDGTEVGTVDNPLHVDIGGNVPDTVGLAQIGGADTAVGAGVTDPGTLRVAVATDDANLAAMNAALDIKQSALRDAVLGADTKDLSTVQTSLDAVKTAVEGTVKTSLQTAIPAGANEIGGVNVTKINGAAAAVNVGTADAGTLRVAVATDDVNLAAITTATAATQATLAAQLDITQSALRDAIQGIDTKDLSTLQASLDAVQATVETTSATLTGLSADVAALKARVDGKTTPIVTAITGVDAIAASYAPATAFYLDAVMVHLSEAPTTAGDLTVTLDAANGEVYDTVLFRFDPSVDGGATDIVFSPLVPIPCVEGDAIVVTYANADGVAHGTRIMARAV